MKERIYISTFSLAGSMKTFLFALNNLRPKQETWVRNRFFRSLAGGSVHKQHWLVKKASGRKTQHNTLPATTRSLKSAFRFMGNPATLSKENNIKSSQLQGERVAARPQKRGEPRINHVAVAGSVLTASQHWRWKNICSPKGHFPHWLKGGGFWAGWKVPLRVCCYGTPGPSLPTKQGWWWPAISLAANQCHCVKTWQENIPIQRTTASTPGPFSQKRPSPEEAPWEYMLSLSQCLSRV